MWRLPLAIVLSTLHFYLTGNNLNKFDSDEKDSSFIPRLMMLSTVLAFVLSLNSPSMPHEVQGRMIVPPYSLWLFTYFIQLISLFLMLITNEPALAVIPIFMTIYTIGVSTQQSAGTTIGFLGELWPFLSAALIGFASFIFFADIHSIDEILDDFESKFDFGFDPSKLPVGYLSQYHSFFKSPLSVAVTLGTLTLCYTYMSKKYSDNYMQTNPNIPSLLNPKTEGPENLARFLAAAQYDAFNESETEWPMKILLKDKKFRQNVIRKS